MWRAGWRAQARTSRLNTNPPAVERRKVSVKVTVGFKKPSSRAFCVEMDASAGAVTHADLSAGQPSGRLLSFFSASFKDDAEVADAFLNSGGSVIVRTRKGTPALAAWGLAEGRVALNLSGTSEGSVVEVKVLIEEATWM